MISAWLSRRAYFPALFRPTFLRPISPQPSQLSPPSPRGASIPSPACLAPSPPPNRGPSDMAGDDFQAPPLYDPSGLSFSLSADADLVGSFDASSFAAHRLGIGVPAKSYPEFASASSLPQGVPEPDLDAEAEAREAFDASVHPADPGSAFAAARPRKRRSYSSPGLAPSPVPPPPEQTQPRLDWWTAASPSPSLVPPSLPPSAQASPAQPKPQPQPPPPSQPHPQPQPRSQPQPRTSAPSDAAGKEGTQGPASAERLASPLRPTQGTLVILHCANAGPYQRLTGLAIFLIMRIQDLPPTPGFTIDHAASAMRLRCPLRNGGCTESAPVLALRDDSCWVSCWPTVASRSFMR